MEEQKYFTPKEEDLRLGFEYEEYLKYQNKWENRIITELSNDRDGGGGFADIEFLISAYPQYVRVSFLNNEQIENEGWYFTQQIGNTLFFKKKDFELTFNNNYININNFGENDLGYWGQCKDVNTLRYITKLLEV